MCYFTHKDWLKNLSDFMGEAPLYSLVWIPGRVKEPVLSKWASNCILGAHREYAVKCGQKFIIPINLLKL
jgi:hypothetical protein